MPEIEIKDQPNCNKFEIHSKTEYLNQTLPITLIAHQDNLKTGWLTEITQYVSDPLALHEHTVDDIRIDPTQIKPDNEGEEFRLPQRKASYESDGIKPSEVAKDYFLTPSEREIYARQQAEEKQILLQQQESFVQRKTQVASVQQKQQQIQQQQPQQAAVSAITQTTKIVKQSEQLVLHNKGEEKHAKLTRSTAIEKSEEIQIKEQETQKQKETVNKNEILTKHIDAEEQTIQLSAAEKLSKAAITTTTTKTTAVDKNINNETKQITKTIAKEEKVEQTKIEGIKRSNDIGKFGHKFKKKF